MRRFTDRCVPIRAVAYVLSGVPSPDAMGAGAKTVEEGEMRGFGALRL